ncbi:hypothetical protein TVAG_157540 [Trichomonas vaginalis G3]|uniref:Right handed beta helix domain-containing protein n=1 Tax=Trichomonas vaginalis (strain ATCC PRA-98 / G3) TaxID=412133 RepID=A2E9M6_TRIV3|nr:hypothetical protein TVAGG3_0746160 [Trichomonas vaginalis G3]EAY10677.1 hypothetical protein TVAG_157540 [Trichomonas vaginalis G3]KAI5512181.1 hypothetical protein TVAGG3_0746160 [Trichomonas vaginalis G3]|eukprot:XP_001322900.1 hypothetical protein [Trichomonas vaginalis G3]
MNSECVLVQICCSFSSVIAEWKYGCAYYIYSENRNIYKNYALECSVSQCSGYYDILAHYYGDIKVSNLNSSYQEITKYSGYCIGYPSVRGIINFTTVSNTSSSEEGVMYNTDGYSFDIIKCNFINNQYTSTHFAFIGCGSSTNYSNCSFIENKAEERFFYGLPFFKNCYFHENTYVEFTGRSMDEPPVSIESGEPLDSLLTHYADEGCISKLSEFKLDITLKVDKIDIENVINIAISIYKISFCQVLNVSLLK